MYQSSHPPDRIYGVTVTGLASCPALPFVYINRIPDCEGEFPLYGPLK